jgi:methylmalonyl-CoA epimerase (EC 5.1.99.1)
MTANSGGDAAARDAGNGAVTIDHAGVVTEDADALAGLYADLLGCERVHEETSDGMLFVFLDLGNGYIELVEPQEEGRIARYLDEHGPGIHHLAVATDDIETALDRARACGVDLIDEQPRSGAWDHDIAFLHPRSTGGVLLEFVEH